MISLSQEKNRAPAQEAPGPWIMACVVFILFNSMGFPGGYIELLGAAFGKLIDYTASP